MIRMRIATSLLFLLTAGALDAQPWSGSAEIGLQISGGRGKALAGAVVTLLYREAGPDAGPPPMLADSRGRVALVGLAAGNWNLEVRHPDHLSYVAAVTLRPGKKAEVTASFLQATGSGRQSMQVKIVKAGGRTIGTPTARPAPPVRVAEEDSRGEPEASEPAPEATAEPESDSPAATEPPAAPLPPPVLGAQGAPEPSAPEPDAPAAAAPPASPESEPASSRPAEPVPVAEIETPEPAPVAESEATPDPVAPPEPSEPETAPVPDSPAAEPPAAMPAPTAPEVPATDPPAPTEPVAPKPPAAAMPSPSPAAPETPAATAPGADPPPVPEPPVSEQPVPIAPPAENEAPASAPLPETAPEPAPSSEPVAAAAEAEAETPGSAPRDDKAGSSTQPALPEAEAPVSAPEMEDPATAAQPPLPKVEAPTPAAQPSMPAPSETVAATPEPEPEAPTAPAPSEAVPEAAPDPAPLPQAPRPRSFQDRTCVECKPGEWAATAVAPVPAGGGPCPLSLDGALRSTLRDLANAGGEITSFAGQAVGAARGTALDRAPAEARQRIATALGDLGAGSSCRLLAVALPAGAKFVGFRFEAFDAGGGGDCTAETGCPIPDARFVANPAIARGADSTVVYTVFENGSAGLGRTARLTAYFVPPSGGWQPR